METWHGRLAHESHGRPARGSICPGQGRDGPATRGQDARATAQKVVIHVLTGESSCSEGYDHEKHRGFGLSVCSVEYDGFTANGRSDASGFRVSVDLPAGQAGLK